MSMLDRSEWYDLARSTSWTPKYVAEDELFPPFMSDAYGIPMELWEKYDEPYKVTYREYVTLQKEKDAAAYSVKSALERTGFYKNADPGWMSVLKAHYGGIVDVEFSSIATESRFCRFFKAPGARNMGTFGALDEMRHAQIQLSFAHALLPSDQQFDWAPRGLQSQNWVSVAVKHTIDDIMHTRDVASTSVLGNFVFETAFTNLQFLALAADATRGGDHSFANLILSIQSDEARHAQIGTPVLRLMLEQGKKAEAQKLVDIGFWRMWKLFSTVSGLAMDYYTPLAQRESSFKEFMHEWVIEQFDRQLHELGLARPWYWDIFTADIDVQHHGQHLGTWLMPESVWWNPASGVGPAEREWLEEKYPGWNANFGRCWDVIIENIRKGDMRRAHLEAIPLLCPMSNLAVTGVAGDHWRNQVYPLEHGGRTYLFGSEVDRWIFLQEPARYQGFKTVVDRFLEGIIQPQTPDGLMTYMGLSKESGEGGKDAHNFQWARADAAR